MAHGMTAFSVFLVNFSFSRQFSYMLYSTTPLFVKLGVPSPKGPREGFLSGFQGFQSPVSGF
jgi:hypothetical protein